MYSVGLTNTTLNENLEDTDGEKSNRTRKQTTKKNTCKAFSIKVHWRSYSLGAEWNRDILFSYVTVRYLVRFECLKKLRAFKIKRALVLVPNRKSPPRWELELLQSKYNLPKPFPSTYFAIPLTQEIDHKK